MVHQIQHSDQRSNQGQPSSSPLQLAVPRINSQNSNFGLRPVAEMRRPLAEISKSVNNVNNIPSTSKKGDQMAAIHTKLQSLVNNSQNIIANE